MSPTTPGVRAKVLTRLIFILWVLLAPHLHAQTDAGELKVLVVDPSDAVVAAAAVNLTRTDTEILMSQSTNAEGYAVFSPIRGANYALTISLNGFKIVKLKDVTIDVNGKRFVKVVLQPSAKGETVEVTAETTGLQTEEGSLGQVVKGDVAVQFPLLARRYTDLALLAPGVTVATDLNPVTRGPDWFVANGNYQTQNNFLLDGFDNNQGTTNAQSLSSEVVRPSPDAIGEFKVQTNSYSAEFGRSAGAVVNVSLKSGSNALHGSGWYYNRDKALASNSWLNGLTGLPKPDLAWHQFGGTIGGPIIKNRLFSFGDYEGFHETFSDTYLRNVPTPAQKHGDFSALTFPLFDPQTGLPFVGNTIPQTRWDGLGAKIVALYPDPNLPGSLQSSGRFTENYGAVRPDRENTHKFDIRSDYYATRRDQFSVRYSFLQQDIFRSAIFPGDIADCGSQDCNNGKQYNRNQSTGVSWTRTLSPRVVNVVRFGYYRTYATFANTSADGPTATDFGFQGIPPDLPKTGGLPRIQISNYQELGTRNFRPQFQKPHLYGILDSLSVAKGAHIVHLGFDLRTKSDEFIDIQRRTPQ